MPRLPEFACFLVLAAIGCFPARAEQGGGKLNQVNAIAADWDDRKGNVKSLFCSARVETFYPKDVLSERNRLNPIDKGTQALFPEDNVRFTDQPIEWTIDFVARKARKEYKLAETFQQNGFYEIGARSILDLFSSGKFRRYFLSKEGVPPQFAASDPNSADADFFEGASHSFFFGLADLPILWFAGGVNGRWPMPEQMQFHETPEKFTVRGDAAWNGTKCAILVLPEQASKTMTREFWVSKSAPYNICRMRVVEPKFVYTDVEVVYEDRDGHAVPVRWVCSNFNPRGKLFVRTSYSVTQFQVNPMIADGSFEKQLAERSVVFHIEKNADFAVDNKGRLIPIGSKEAFASWYWLWFGFLAAGALALVWRRHRFHDGRT